MGPDLILELAQHPMAAPIVVVADPELLMARAEALGLPVELSTYLSADEPIATRPCHLTVLPVSLRAPVRCGHLEPANAEYVLETLRHGVYGCRSESFAALVTGPVHKGIINRAGIAFSGHTEFLAERSGARQPVMMLTTPGLRVALATTHLPLTQVSAAITRDRLETVLRVLVGDLQRAFAIPSPRVLVCGLNPHAGEDGHLGREEIEVIDPVLKTLRGEGMDLVGPLSADTAFTPPRLAETDAVLAMYHDQGLPVLKHMGFGNAVNVTLGLPFVRTSVDHGTALELAGSGQADAGSLRAALALAKEMVFHRATASADRA